MKSGQIGSFRDGLVPLPFLTIAAVTWEQKVISAGLVAARPLAPIFGLEGADWHHFQSSRAKGGKSATSLAIVLRFSSQDHWH